MPRPPISTRGSAWSEIAAHASSAKISSEPCWRLFISSCPPTRIDHSWPRRCSSSRCALPGTCARSISSHAIMVAGRVYHAGMELFDALGPEVARTLAERRASVPRKMFLHADAASELAQALAADGVRDVTVLFDVRTRDAAAGPVLRALRAAGIAVRELLVPDQHGHPPSCDDQTKAALQKQLPAHDALLGIGAGVI